MSKAPTAKLGDSAALRRPARPAYSGIVYDSPPRAAIAQSRGANEFGKGAFVVSFTLTKALLLSVQSIEAPTRQASKTSMSKRGEEHEPD